MVVLIACGLSLLELEPLLTDRDFRQRMLQHVEDPLVVSFFQHQYDRWGREQPIFVSPVLNKVSAFLFKPQIRTMLGADDNALDFRRIIDEGKILIINLGCFRDEETQRLLGSLFLTSLEQAAFSRSNQPPHARRPVSLAPTTSWRRTIITWRRRRILALDWQLTMCGLCLHFREICGQEEDKRTWETAVQDQNDLCA